MKIKKLEEWGPIELLIFAIVFIFTGYTLGRFFENKGIVMQISSIIIMLTGLVFFAAGIGKLLKTLEDRGKIEILREEPPKSFKEFILVVVIPLLISVAIYYWFELRPRQIAQKCFIEAITTHIDSIDIDPFSESSEKNTAEENYQECLKKHNLEKYLEK